MRKMLLIGLIVAAPVLIASSEPASAWGWGCGNSGARYYGYSAPRVYGYSYYRPWRFYGARTYGWRAGLGVRRWGWGGRRRW